MTPEGRNERQKSEMTGEEDKAALSRVARSLESLE